MPPPGDLEIVAEVLRAAGLRVTRPRVSILERLGGTSRFVSAQELHDAMALAGRGVGLSTVYRTLQSLSAAGALHTVVIHGEVAYRVCRSGHHHHVVCPDCGLAEEDCSPLVEQWVSEVCLRNGRDLTSHRVDAFLRCPRCAARSPGAVPPRMSGADRPFPAETSIPLTSTEPR